MTWSLLLTCLGAPRGRALETWKTGSMEELLNELVAVCQENVDAARDRDEHMRSVRALSLAVMVQSLQTGVL